MIPLLTADEMRALEKKAIEGWGIPSIVLQEQGTLLKYMETLPNYIV